MFISSSKKNSQAQHLHTYRQTYKPAYIHPPAKVHESKYIKL